MATFFDLHPFIPYRFGSNEPATLWNNLSIYADLIDQIKDNVTVYEEYTIGEGERPDNVSVMLYNTPEYYWTFFLLNDDLRVSGWPVGRQEAYQLAQDLYPNWVLTTEDDLSATFPVGQTVTGNTSSSTGQIIERNLDLGQLVVKGDTAFQDGEVITYTDSQGAVQSVTLYSQAAQYNAIHNYEDTDGNHVDIDPFDIDTSTSGLIPVTYTDRFIRRNEELKLIKVLKRESVINIVGQYMDAIRQ